jgi:hypothetical protein
MAKAPGKAAQSRLEQDWDWVVSWAGQRGEVVVCLAILSRQGTHVNLAAVVGRTPGLWRRPAKRGSRQAGSR